MPGRPGSAYVRMLQCSRVRVPVPHAALLVGTEVSWLWRGIAWHNGIDIFRIMCCFQRNWCFRLKFQLLESKTAGSGGRGTQRPVD